VLPSQICRKSVGSDPKDVSVRRTNALELPETTTSEQSEPCGRLAAMLENIATEIVTGPGHEFANENTLPELSAMPDANSSSSSCSRAMKVQRRKSHSSAPGSTASCALSSTC
jgi:hypothetical protein